MVSYLICAPRLKLKKSDHAPNITTLKVNLVESSGSLTPEELGQKQGMSVVLARYFSLIRPVKQNIPLKIFDVNVSHTSSSIFWISILFFGWFQYFWQTKYSILKGKASQRRN